MWKLFDNCQIDLKFRIIFFQVLKSLLQSMLEDFQKVYTLRQSATMRKHATAGRRLSQTILALACATCIIYVFLRLVIHHHKINKTGKRDWLFESEFTFGFQESPWFEIVWSLQCVGATLGAAAYAGFDSFFGLLVWHLCGQLVLLRNELTVVSSRLYVQGSIARIARRHNELNRFEFWVDYIFYQVFIESL